LRSTGEVDLWQQAREKSDPGGMRTIGWSFIPLFSDKEALLTGAWKVPIYLPPTMMDIDVKRFQ